MNKERKVKKNEYAIHANQQKFMFYAPQIIKNQIEEHKMMEFFTRLLN